MAEESSWRLLVFISVLLCMLLAESLAPRRRQPADRIRRWLTHGGIQLINGVLLRLLFPGAAVGLAVFGEAQGWGVLSHWSWPAALQLLITLLLLDLAIYAQHVATHHWSWLWRLHRMHHSDTQVDASTALRFHPLEILLSMLWKGALILLLGLPAWAVLIYEMLLNAMALFNHANWRLPLVLDRLLRRVLVTPDMHRVHHSVHVHETNANFGNLLSIWDRLFATYVAQPRDGHERMRLGLAQFRAAREQRLLALLKQPLRAD